MNEILKTLYQADIFVITIYSLVINTGIYAGSLLLYTLLSKLPFNHRLGSRQPILRSDILLSFITVLCNMLVFIIGVLLWKYGVIKLSPDESIVRIAVEVIVLILVMDFLMYVFHRAVHFMRYFRKIHERHHEHESTNMLSLFVLHPIESIGFGLMMLAVITVFPFSAVGISLYLLINSLWGTIGHLNHSVLPQWWLRKAKKMFLCTSEFHYLHHQYPGFNFGFYTAAWDILFHTLHPSLKRERRHTM